MTEKRMLGKVDGLLAGFAAFRFAGGRRVSVVLEWTDLLVLPYFDCRAAETPRAAHAEAWYSSFAHQAVDRRRMDPEMRGQLGDRQNVFGGCHRYAHREISRFPFNELYRSKPNSDPFTSL